MQADHGDHGNHRVAQRVLPDHPVLRQALGTGGADVILPHHVKHAGARDTRDQRDEIGCERDRRQHEMIPIPAATGRKQPEPDREHDDADDAEEKGRDGLADQRQRADRVIDRPVMALGRDHPGGNSDHQGQDHRRKRQLGRRAKPLHHQLRRGLVEAQRIAEISLQHARAEFRELFPERTVETMRGTERLACGLGRIRRQHHIRRIAAESNQQERHQGDAGKHGNREEQSVGDVGEHRGIGSNGARSAPLQRDRIK